MSLFSKKMFVEKCSHPDGWYKHLIGKVVNVKEFGSMGFYMTDRESKEEEKRTNKVKIILFYDCRPATITEKILL